MAEIEAGDLVFGSSGQPIQVIAISPVQIDRACFRVTFENGDSVVADAGHEWTVSSKSDRSTVTLTTAQIFKRGVYKKDSSRYKRYVWRVQLTESLDFGTQFAYKIAPYVLGLWLGDGTASDGSFTTNDPELLEAWKDWRIIKRPSSKFAYGTRGFRLVLKMQGLLNNKHIPSEYMNGSIEDRKALLAGLLDTDGYADKGVAYFYNTNKKLAYQVNELAIQLGCKTKFSSKIATLNGKDCGLVYTIGIRSSFQVFRLKRKMDNFQLNQETYQAIHKIEPVESEPVKCLVVNAEDHLFLCGLSCIPTHNSYAALQLAEAIVCKDHWLGFPVKTNGPVVYVQLDTPRSLWATRLDELSTSGHNVDCVHEADRDTLGVFPFDALNPDHAQLLRNELAKVMPVAVVIDTVREAHDGNENDSTDMKRVISALTSITQPAAMILISHSRKFNAETGYSLMNDNRGSNYVPGKMDSIIRFTPKSIRYQGRAIEEGSLKLDRGDDGFWIQDSLEKDAALKKVLGDKSLASDRARSRALALLLSQPEETCRGMIRRAKK